MATRGEMKLIEHWTEKEIRDLRKARPLTAGGGTLSLKSTASFYKVKQRASAITSIKAQQAKRRAAYARAGK